jgi:Gamma-glutamyltransferase
MAGTGSRDVSRIRRLQQPATSRGGIELAMQLNLVEGFDLAKMGANSPEALHLLIEAIKLAKADVYRYVADPKFTQVRWLVCSRRLRRVEAQAD